MKEENEKMSKNKKYAEKCRGFRLFFIYRNGQIYDKIGEWHDRMQKNSILNIEPQ